MTFRNLILLYLFFLAKVCVCQTSFDTTLNSNTIKENCVYKLEINFSINNLCRFEDQKYEQLNYIAKILQKDTTLDLIVITKGGAGNWRIIYRYTECQATEIIKYLVSQNVRSKQLYYTNLIDTNLKGKSLVDISFVFKRDLRKVISMINVDKFRDRIEYKEYKTLNKGWLWLDFFNDDSLNVKSKKEIKKILLKLKSDTSIYLRIELRIYETNSDVDNFYEGKENFVKKYFLKNNICENHLLIERSGSILKEKNNVDVILDLGIMESKYFYRDGLQLYLEKIYLDCLKEK